MVALAGVLDLGLAAALGLGGGATQALLGGEPASSPDRYAVADPARLLPTGVPTVLVHGTRDEDGAARGEPVLRAQRPPRRASRSPCTSSPAPTTWP